MFRWSLCTCTNGPFFRLLSSFYLFSSSVFFFPSFVFCLPSSSVLRSPSVPLPFVSSSSSLFIRSSIFYPPPFTLHLHPHTITHYSPPLMSRHPHFAPCPMLRRSPPPLMSRHPHVAPCPMSRHQSSPAVTRHPLPRSPAPPLPRSPLSRYTAGDPSVDLYFIKSGMVEMKDCTGRYILCEHGEGEYFGDVRSPVHRFTGLPAHRFTVQLY